MRPTCNRIESMNGRTVSANEWKCVRNYCAAFCNTQTVHSGSSRARQAHEIFTLRLIEGNGPTSGGKNGMQSIAEIFGNGRRWVPWKASTSTQNVEIRPQHNGIETSIKSGSSSSHVRHVHFVCIFHIQFISRTKRLAFSMMLFSELSSGAHRQELSGIFKCCVREWCMCALVLLVVDVKHSQVFCGSFGLLNGAFFFFAPISFSFLFDSMHQSVAGIYQLYHCTHSSSSSKRNNCKFQNQIAKSIECSAHKAAMHIEPWASCLRHCLNSMSNCYCKQIESEIRLWVRVYTKHSPSIRFTCKCVLILTRWMNA